MDQISPGSYDPSTSFYKNKKDNDIQNFGSFEKRIQEKNDLYYIIQEWDLIPSKIHILNNLIDTSNLLCLLILQENIQKE